ncbi:MAG: RnfABCDGE type electron transport complex subunit D [Fluviibacter sp.]
MPFQTPNVLTQSPYLVAPVSVSKIMLKVLLAMVPGIIAYVYLFGIGILVQLAIATVTAVVAEAAFLRIRHKRIAPALADLSAVVTAWLIALSFPPVGPWWLVMVGTLFAIVVVKQLYGGLGQNPFNPAMAAYAICIVSFPAVMSQWPVTLANGGLSALDQISTIFNHMANVDAWAGATPLDHLKTTLRLSMSNDTLTVQSIAQNQKIYGVGAGQGWEWVTLCWLLGGLWLWQQRIITWHIPVAFIAAIGGLALLCWGLDPLHYANPVFHVFGGATLLGAFFIATDPVTGATTPRGKLIFAAGAGIIAYLIRVFGAFPDGVAFGILLMNICVPLIDMYTQPPIFGEKSKKDVA